MKNVPKNQKLNTGKFAKGSSGNLAGRPQGSRNKATLLMEQMFEGAIEKLTRKVIEMAQEGNIGAMKICMERLLPPCEDRPIRLDLPAIENMAQVSAALTTVVAGIADGAITPREGEIVANILAVQTNVVATTDMDRRLKDVEDTISTMKSEKGAEGAMDIAEILHQGRTPESAHDAPA